MWIFYYFGFFFFSTLIRFQKILRRILGSYTFPCLSFLHNTTWVIQLTCKDLTRALVHQDEGMRIQYTTRTLSTVQRDGGRTEHNVATNNMVSLISNYDDHSTLINCIHHSSSIRGEFDDAILTYACLHRGARGKPVESIKCELGAQRIWKLRTPQRGPSISRFHWPNSNFACFSRYPH
jgi:hypothetical protein